MEFRDAGSGSPGQGAVRGHNGITEFNGVGGGGKRMEVHQAGEGANGSQWGSGRAHGARGQWLVGTNVIAGAAAAMPIGRLQCQDLEGSEWGGARLGGNHAPEASHGPRAHMVVVGTDWGARGWAQVRPAMASPPPILSSPRRTPMKVS